LLHRPEKVVEGSINTENIMSDTVSIAADYIRTHDAKLADMFVAQPFRRVQIAQAFAKGLSVPAGEHDYGMGETIIALAEIDRAERQSVYAESER
jgi:hypothetical protein